jgi:iron complex transport system substrate-binding protein
MKTKTILLFLLCLAMAACRKAPGGQTATHEGDTIRLKYAQKLTIVKHKEYTEVKLSDPWNIGKTLHTYLLVAADAQLPGQMPQGTVIRTPVRRAVISTSVHCGLVDQLGQRDAVKGVCDVQYIHLPFVEQGCKDGSIADCGSALAPAVEKVLDLQPDAIFLSPFQNSGGYGRVSELNIPVIETADYMETSPLGRAEWMRFYGMLFGKEQQADSLFAEVDKEYGRLKAEGGMKKDEGGRKTVLMDKLTGSVWYVPGGKSTIGQMISDAGIGYAWSEDESSGSLSLPFEAVLEKTMDADIWMFRYSAPHDITSKELLSEKAGYSQFRAFREGNIYGCNNSLNTFYEDTPFHPERLLRDFICIAHPEKNLGEPKYFIKVKK